ncbi:DUF2304 domain-containing protein [Paenibacillus sp. MMS18-CY102]|uniref:DUF2304 domain-containing protein n=1 Tax=Paenibacillus sp. MMS18-CY102 TaxID=2682849 RepID=UPI001365D0FD|nr:DUF2304 domain-containing protein [Paenibacillus sp. MMS18-CY102]MWC27300.1 DUF2304 family protein [Paenibacillus sp. MMS18-CY102]
MISLKLQLILLVISILCFLVIINMIRKYKLELKYTLLWLLISLVMIILAVFPKLYTFISHAMGIELPVNALFLSTIFCAFVIIFYLTVTVSRSSTKIKELSQELGLLKYEVDELKRSIQREQ